LSSAHTFISDDEASAPLAAEYPKVFTPSSVIYVVFLVLGCAVTYRLGTKFFTGHTTANSILAAILFLGIFARGREGFLSFVRDLGHRLLIAVLASLFLMYLLYLLFG
jgi:hypothetical protein